MQAPQATGETHGRWRRRKVDRPAEILEAALAIFVERGFRASRLEDVGARAGVTKGTIYLYFRNKEALFVQVVRETIEPFLTEAEHTIAGYDGSAEELLTLLVHRYWTRLGQDKMAAITRLMQVEGANFPDLAAFYASEVLGRGRRIVEQVLQHGVARGELRSVDPAYFADALFAVLELASTQRYTFRRYDTAQLDPTVLVHTALDLLLRGLVTPATPAPVNREESRG